MTEILGVGGGKVALMSTYGDDRTPARTARTSFRNQGATSKKTGLPYSEGEDAALTKYLVDHRHTTPIEFCEATFYMEMPIFVARQLVRHRTASINEESLRYVDARDEFYVPEIFRLQKQSTSNKQGSSPELVKNPELVKAMIEEANRTAYNYYNQLLDTGLAKELARGVLPLNTFTAWYWKCDMHNIQHMLGLRLDPHAQWEIRQYAGAIYSLLKLRFPVLMQAWEDKRKFDTDARRLLQANLDGNLELASQLCDEWCNGR
jgi:thymidylate synthase (FAD)